VRNGQRIRFFRRTRSIRLDYTTFAWFLVPQGNKSRKMAFG